MTEQKWTPDKANALIEKMWLGKYGMVPVKMRRRTGRPPFAVIASVQPRPAEAVEAKPALLARLRAFFARLFRRGGKK